LILAGKGRDVKYYMGHKERGGKHQGGIFKHGTIAGDDDVMLVKWDFKEKRMWEAG
jgi:hypothetical protein